MARRIGRLVALTILAVTIAGCPRAGSETGGRPGDAAPSAPAQSPVPWAANAADVARFADEEPLGPDAIIAHNKTAVRTSPGGGAVVATLPAGAEVVKLSTHGDEDLVWFDDPKPGGLHLTGWVAQSALEESRPAADANARRGRRQRAAVTFASRAAVTPRWRTSSSPEETAAALDGGRSERHVTRRRRE